MCAQRVKRLSVALQFPQETSARIGLPGNKYWLRVRGKKRCTTCITALRLPVGFAGGSEPARVEGRELEGQYLLLAFIFSSCLFFVNVEVCAIQKPSN